MVSGADGSDSIVDEEFGGLGFFGPLKFDIGLTSKAMGGRFRLD